MENKKNYDLTDKYSIIRHAKRLKGHTLKDFIITGEIDSANKGGFGQVLESGYFHLDNNNIPLPDFIEVGVELKSTPMKKLKKGSYAPKERLVLGIINYVEIAEQSFEESFMIKNKNLLIIFYLYEEIKDPMEYKILDVVEWIFPQKDLEIIKKDWEKIKDMVMRGSAHEISGGMTFYLEAMTKGAGHGKDLREQPFSDILAKQRAFGLKGRYVKHIFESSKPDIITSPMITDVSILKEKHIEDIVVEKLSPYVGMSISEIIEKTGIMIKGGKDRYAGFVRALLGVEGRYIEEFENAGIIMRVIRPESDGRLVESISFPYIRYDEIVYESWEESDFYDRVTSRFLFVILQKIKGSKELVFRGIKFWSMPENDLDIVHEVWEDTVRKIQNGNYDDFIPLSADMIAHVRPHGRDSRDLAVGPDGNWHSKKCFWLNAKYIVKSIITPFLKYE